MVLATLIRPKYGYINKSESRWLKTRLASRLSWLLIFLSIERRLLLCDASTTWALLSYTKCSTNQLIGL